MNHKNTLKVHHNLKRIASEKGYSIHRLALEARISPTDLYSAVNGERRFFPKWRERVAQVLGVDEETIFREGEEHEEE